MELTIRQAATLLACSPRTLRARVSRGDLKARKAGRSWMIASGDLPLTEAQRDSLVTRCEEIRTAVDEALPNLSTRRRRSVEDLRPVAALRNLIHDHGEVLPPVVLRLLRHGVCLLCEAKHEFDARRKRSAFERARVAVAHAVGHILIAAKGDTSPVRFELEQEVLPAISGLVRWSERRRR